MNIIDLVQKLYCKKPEPACTQQISLCDDLISVLYEHQCNDPNFLLFLKKNGYNNILKKDLTDWKLLSQEEKISKEFITEFKEELYWGEMCFNSNLSKLFKWKHKINLNHVIKHYTLSENFLSENFLHKYYLSENFLHTYYWSKLSWKNRKYICHYQDLTENFVNIHIIPHLTISPYSSDTFLCGIYDCMIYIFRYQNFSEDFLLSLLYEMRQRNYYMRQYHHFIDWLCISNNLSEDFIHNNQYIFNQQHWEILSRKYYNTFSDDFINQHTQFFNEKCWQYLSYRI